jgi:NAD(P)H-flavin reductase
MSKKLSESFNAIVSRLERIAPDKLILEMETDRKLDYAAGQYLGIKFSDNPERPYSIAAAPSESNGKIEIHIKDSGNKGVSSHIFNNIKNGDTATLTGPHGDCTLGKNNTESLLIIAGGMGIAPAKAIVEQALADDNHKSVVLYWGAQTKEDFYIDKIFQSYAAKHSKLRYITNTAQPIGLHAANNEQNLEQTEIFIFGPPAMISHTIPLLLRNNAQRHLIRIENTFFDISKHKPRRES